MIEVAAVAAYLVAYVVVAMACAKWSPAHVIGGALAVLLVVHWMA